MTDEASPRRSSRFLRFISAVAGGGLLAVLIALAGMIPLTVVVGVVGAWLVGPRDIQGPAGLMLSAPLGLGIGGLYAFLKCSPQPRRRRAAAWIGWGTIAVLLLANFAVLGAVIARS